MKRFGEKLRTLRVRHGLSLRKLSAILEIDYSHLGKIEAGTSGPSANLILKIANFFNITPNELMLDELELE